MPASATEIQRQLMVFHDPFDRATKQPKIPDGKCTESLGFSTQSVVQLSNKQYQDTVHILMFAGQNSGYVATHVAQTNLGTRFYYIPGFTGSGGPDWSFISNLDGGLIKQRDEYANWRVVSQGLQIKLMNAAEEDDGWWEAVRYSDALSTVNHALTTVDNSQNLSDDGTVAPVFEIDPEDGGNITKRSIVNEPSYATGLLRDLNKVQFNLHGRKDHHDFTSQMNEIQSGPLMGVPAGQWEAIFKQGDVDAERIINQFIDDGYDMVYIRLHCRSNTGQSPYLGSRFHVNCVSNQEINFDSGQRESRYQTRSGNVGDQSEMHAGLRNSSNAAASIISD